MRKSNNKTLMKTCKAQDYDVACKIRAYIKALGSSENWIDWAKKKADWIDHTVERIDELFGKREHEKNEEQKALRKSYY